MIRVFYGIARARLKYTHEIDRSSDWHSNDIEDIIIYKTGQLRLVIADTKFQPLSLNGSASLVQEVISMNILRHWKLTKLGQQYFNKYQYYSIDNLKLFALELDAMEH